MQKVSGKQPASKAPTKSSEAVNRLAKFKSKPQTSRQKFSETSLPSASDKGMLKGKEQAKDIKGHPIKGKVSQESLKGEIPLKRASTISVGELEKTKDESPTSPAEQEIKFHPLEGEGKGSKLGQKMTEAISLMEGKGSSGSNVKLFKEKVRTMYILFSTL